MTSDTLELDVAQRNGMLSAQKLAEIIIDAAKNNELHLVYSLIKTRDHIWSGANRASTAPNDQEIADAIRRECANNEESISDGAALFAAHAVIELFERKSPVSDVEQRLRTALEELIGAAEHCGDGDVPVVIKARAALASGSGTDGER